jgi:hypothetical protein
MCKDEGIGLARGQPASTRCKSKNSKATQVSHLLPSCALTSLADEIIMYDVLESGVTLHHTPTAAPSVNGAEFLQRIRYFLNLSMALNPSISSV